MKRQYHTPLTTGLLTALAALGLTTAGSEAGAASAAAFAHPNLHAVMADMAGGTPVTVVFFGGSITWGATATDPLRTSWRALVERELRARHPRTPLTFVDAAIGGQPSQLGVFRMDRDVLPFEPDLVFVEFTVNDGTRGGSEEWMEGIIRKLRARRPSAAIVPVVFGYAAAGHYVSPGRERHLPVFEHYGLPVIDTLPTIRQRVADGLPTTAFLTDGVHPNDTGYRLYADIVLDQLDQLASLPGTPAEAPAAPVTENRYESARMIELASVEALSGWEAGIPSVVGTWFDHQPSRWHSSTVRPTEAGAHLLIEDNLTGAGLYFELVPDGKPLLLRVGETLHLELKTANNLDYARINYAFKWLPEPGPQRISLEAPEGGPAAAAYLLATGPHS